MFLAQADLMQRIGLSTGWQGKTYIVQVGGIFSAAYFSAEGWILFSSHRRSASWQSFKILGRIPIRILIQGFDDRLAGQDLYCTGGKNLARHILARKVGKLAVL